MPVAVTEEQVALGESVRGWAERAGVRASARALLDLAPGEHPGRPGWWAQAVALGLPALALPEAYSGAGAGVVEAAVAIDELGRALAPGPLVPTTVAALTLLVAARDPEGEKAAAELLPGVAAGEVALAVALDLDSGVVLGGAAADHLVVGLRDGTGERWAVVPAAALAAEATPSLDPTRPVARVRVDAAALAAGSPLPGLDSGLVRSLAASLLAAEAAGLAGWALDTAVGYAKVREQFGRPIGSFQSIKHLCADMLARSEMAAAAAWDAARAADGYLRGSDTGADRKQLGIAAATAVQVAVEGAVKNAEDCVQVLGGIGYTWEHDAHLALRRALSLRALLGGPQQWRAGQTRLARAGVRRRLSVDLGADAEPLRARVREAVRDLPADPAARRRALADAGLMTPHWPQPFGLDASPLDQLAIQAELDAAGVEPPDLIIGNWAVPTIIEHGTDAQRERFVRPTLHGEIKWCQMFSEPGAGSDLASLRTRATRTDGGWLLNGQKVWTSSARDADWAICLARTNPDAPQHKGITYFLVDMRTPGLDVRPLREMTGEALFNEVFLTDVLVPDDCVLGPVDGGWRLARTTLANERVSMSTTTGMGAGLDELVAHTEPKPVLDDRIGALLAGVQAAAVLGLRTVLRQLGGLDPGPASSVRKLVGMHHNQDGRELALEALGPLGAVVDERSAAAIRTCLSTRALTIAGGTSQVLRNVIAERLLGLPRD